MLPEGETVIDKEKYLEIRKRKNSSVKKLPNILLYFDIFLALKSALKESSKYTEDAIRKEKVNEDKELYKDYQKLVTSKRRKICDLLELYIHQQHMRSGATNLIESLQQLRYSETTEVDKEKVERCILERHKNVERLLTIENQVNTMSGSFRFQILGLLGFSRVCPGDVYELSFRHGSLKSKSRCKIEPLGQVWTDPEFYFQANFSNDFFVKIFEAAKIGKGNQIGAVSFNLQEFITSIPKVFILPLNSNGTLKLKLGVLWSPLTKVDGKQYDKLNPPPHLKGIIDFTKAEVVSAQTGQISRRRSANDGHLQSNNLSPPPTRNGYALNRPSKSQPTSPNNYSSNYNGLTNSPTNKSKPFSYTGNTSPITQRVANISPSTKRPNHLPLNSRNSSGSSNDSSSGNMLNNNFINTNDSEYRRYSHEPKSLHPPDDNYYIPRSYSDGLVRLQNSKKKAMSNSTAQQESARNDVRQTKMPMHMNNNIDLSSSWSSGIDNRKIPLEKRSSNKSLQEPSKNRELIKKPSFSTGVKSPPPQIRPKPRSATAKLTPISNLEIKNQKTAGVQLIELCEKIISKLDMKRSISSQIPNLESILTEIMQKIQKNNRTRKPSLTESIASALDSFDFLQEEPESPINSKSFTNQWDVYARPLFHHLYMVYDLIIDYMPPQGPLVENEKFYLEKLKENTRALKELSRVINTYDPIELSDICQRYSGSSTLTNTWEVTASMDTPLHCTCTDLYVTFMALYEHVDELSSSKKYKEVKEKVCRYAVDEICGDDYYETDKDIISLYQFVDFFKDKVRTHNVGWYLTCITNELKRFTELLSKDDLIVSSALQEWWTIPVVPCCIQQLVTMLINGKSIYKNIVLTSLSSITKSNANNSFYELTSILLRCLEDRNSVLRTGACMALGKLQVHQSAQQLMYIYETDIVPLVKDAALNALNELGHSGR